MKSPAVAIRADRRHLRHARPVGRNAHRRTRRRCTCGPAPTSACVTTNGAAATTPGCAAPSSSTGCQSFITMSIAVRQHANVRAADENLLTKIVLQPVHHAHDDDQRAHADRHAADRDDADQRQQLRSAPAAQIAPRDATARGRLIRAAASERGSRRGCSACW